MRLATAYARRPWLPLAGIGPSRYDTVVEETLLWSFNPRSSVQLDYQQQSGQNGAARALSAEFHWSL
ncbi:MAG: hypothetical protein ACREVO_01500 [Steroidobacteraceae bacterium]